MDEKPFEVGRGTVMIGGTMLTDDFSLDLTVNVAPVYGDNVLPLMNSTDIVVHEFRKAAGMSAPELMRVVIPDVKFAAAPYDVT